MNHPIIQKEEQLSSYLKEWINSRYPDWNEFYQSEYPYRQQGIYQLKDGDRLLDMLNDIMGNVENHLLVNEETHLIPSKFSSINQLLSFLLNFDTLIKSKYHYVEENICGEQTNYVVVKIISICEDIGQMVTRCRDIYMADDFIPIPYKQAKDSLINNDVAKFIDIMKSLIKGIPYDIRKETVNEGYFHTLFHVITTMLGMKPESEQELQDGRLDMMFETPCRIYIFEFKCSEAEDMSKTAIEQIIDKQYDLKYHIYCKEIIGVGVSFSKTVRNINGHELKSLFVPLPSPS